ncbi:MAG: hypothetical protein MJK12_20990 [Colwellia sp.]|nr:hypothetical protein [Colwellia sp.]
MIERETEPSWLHPLAIATPFIGIAFSWFYFKSYRENNGDAIVEKQTALIQFCRNGLGFDTLYQFLLVKPYCWLAKVNRLDVIDQLIMLNAWYVSLWHDALSAMQNGKLRWYAAALGLGVICFVGVIAFGDTRLGGNH